MQAHAQKQQQQYNNPTLVKNYVGIQSNNSLSLSLSISHTHTHSTNTIFVRSKIKQQQHQQQQSTNTNVSTMNCASLNAFEEAYDSINSFSAKQINVHRFCPQSPQYKLLLGDTKRGKAFRLIIHLVGYTTKELEDVIGDKIRDEMRANKKLTDEEESEQMKKVIKTFDNERTKLIKDLKKDNTIVCEQLPKHLIEYLFKGKDGLRNCIVFLNKLKDNDALTLDDFIKSSDNKKNMNEYVALPENTTTTTTATASSAATNSDTIHDTDSVEDNTDNDDQSSVSAQKTRVSTPKAPSTGSKTDPIDLVCPDSDERKPPAQEKKNTTPTPQLSVHNSGLIHGSQTNVSIDSPTNAINSTAPAISAQPSGEGLLDSLRAGTKVQIKGLIKAKAHNGKFATVVEEQAVPEGRVGVKLGCGKVISVKRQNLGPVLDVAANDGGGNGVPDDGELRIDNGTADDDTIHANASSTSAQTMTTLAAVQPPPPPAADANEKWLQAKNKRNWQLLIVAFVVFAIIGMCCSWTGYPFLDNKATKSKLSMDTKSSLLTSQEFHHRYLQELQRLNAEDRVNRHSTTGQAASEAEDNDNDDDDNDDEVSVLPPDNDEDHDDAGQTIAASLFAPHAIPTITSTPSGDELLDDGPANDDDAGQTIAASLFAPHVIPTVDDGPASDDVAGQTIAASLFAPHVIPIVTSTPSGDELLDDRPASAAQAIESSPDSIYLTASETSVPPSADGLNGDGPAIDGQTIIYPPTNSLKIAPPTTAPPPLSHTTKSNALSLVTTSSTVPVRSEARTTIMPTASPTRKYSPTSKTTESTDYHEMKKSDTSTVSLVAIGDGRTTTIPTSSTGMNDGATSVGPAPSWFPPLVLVLLVLFSISKMFDSCMRRANL